MQLIESVGLRAEEHRVETDDGYILTLHRWHDIAYIVSCAEP